MWLAIKRQSQIQHIYYIDVEIEDYLFEKMIEDKELVFFNEKISIDNKAVFKEMRLNRYIWDSLLIYDEEVRAQEDVFEEFIST